MQKLALFCPPVSRSESSKSLQKSLSIKGLEIFDTKGANDTLHGGAGILAGVLLRLLSGRESYP